MSCTITYSTSKAMPKCQFYGFAKKKKIKTKIESAALSIFFSLCILYIWRRYFLQVFLSHDQIWCLAFELKNKIRIKQYDVAKPFGVWFEESVNCIFTFYRGRSSALLFFSLNEWTLTRLYIFGMASASSTFFKYI